MVNKFLENLTHHIPDAKSRKFLLAVSGGVDSVTMCHLFYRAGLHFGIAHCNFGLRGKESERDAQLVKQLSRIFKVPFYSVKFKTQKIAADKKISIQMAAREMRYDCLRAIKKKHNYDFISTAHHRDDQIETFLLNLIRGTGIKGLLGIHPLDKDLFRPLLFISKEEIVNYAVKEKLNWREDSSNKESVYKRNFLRHNVLPLLKKINPSFEKTIIETIEKLIFPAQLYENEIKRIKGILKNTENLPCKIHFNIIRKKFSSPPLLWEFLSRYGFTYYHCKEILNALSRQPGTQFYSETHRIIIDRNHIVIDSNKTKEKKDFLISEGEKEIHTDHFIIRISKRSAKNLKMNPSDRFAYLDENKLLYPLVLRRWESGDSFIPLGMKGKKKISDFLVDRKLSRIDKENVWVLVSGGNISWVVGFRIDERFKIADTTKRAWVGKIVEI